MDDYYPPPTIEEHVIAVLQNATKFRLPFPYFFAENVFPSSFYDEMQLLLQNKHDFKEEKFKNRTFATDSTLPGTEFMLSKAFFNKMLYLFLPELKRDFGGLDMTFSRDLRLIRDQKGYTIGPHTDAPWKVLSLLFYLPPDDAMRDYGTSFLVPNDPTFRDPGGPHLNFENFREVWRAPFLPNSCLGFWKTDQSFHGVYPIPIPVRRDVLLYNIYRRDIDGDT